MRAEVLPILPFPSVTEMNIKRKAGKERKESVSFLRPVLLKKKKATLLASFKDSNRNQTLTEKNLEATSRSNSAAELHKYKFGK